MAKLWYLKGAKWIHVVDLNGALTGKPIHIGIVKRICREVKAKVEFGGGVRSMDVIAELVEAGVQRVILGTSAVDQASLVQKAVARFGGKIAVALDVRRGKLATQGWKTIVSREPLEMAREMQKLGVGTFVFTEVSRDGMLKGPAFKATSDFVRQAGAKVIASGGITKLSNLVKLKKLEPFGLIGAIVGKALYSGDMDLKQALALGEAKARSKKRPKKGA
jgi:phosphoribosylformimino-5-aminoimidazole carboxamide ribotide isomerase